MPKEKKEGKVVEGKEEVEKKLEEYEKGQLPLGFIFPQPAEEKDYSNTIELYDAIPKYHWGRVERIEGKFLEPLKRNFRFREKDYKAIVTPARIEDKDGVFRDYYMGEREELVEDALRKLACDGGGCFLDDQASVVFSLYELREELKRMGHTYSLAQIKDALLICTKSNIDLRSADGEKLMTSSAFETLGLQTKEQWKGKGKKTRCFVRFNVLVTRSIKNRSFRQLNYRECMEYHQSLARWLHKRISHVYRQAGFNNTYSIKLSTIIRDSGMKQYARLRDNLKKVREALKEMQEKQVVLSFKENKVVEHKTNKMIDVVFEIKGGMSFVRDIKKGNKYLVDVKKTK